MKKINTHKSIYDPEGNPLDYPGQIIDTPLLVTNGSAQAIHASEDFIDYHTTDHTPVNTILQQRCSTITGQRVAQIAFGANRNLENITWKFQHYNKTVSPVSQDFIALPGYLLNCEVAACNIGYWGYIYSGLLAAPPDMKFRNYLKGSRCPVTLLLVDQSQMAAIHHSEGVVLPGTPPPAVSCGVSEMEVHLSESVVCMAQVYSLSVPFLSFDSLQPVAFESVATSGRSGCLALSQEEMFCRINSLLQAEPEIPGRVPIAETLRLVNMQLLKKGVTATRKMDRHPLYSTVREGLINKHTLRDKDGKIRRGLEDIVPVKTAEAAWHMQPLYQPRSCAVIDN